MKVPWDTNHGPVEFSLVTFSGFVLRAGTAVTEEALIAMREEEPIFYPVGVSAMNIDAFTVPYNPDKSLWVIGVDPFSSARPDSCLLTTADIVVVSSLSFAGDAASIERSGVEYEYGQLGFDEVFGMDESWIAGQILEHDSGKEDVNLVVLYWYCGWKEPDTWLGPGEYDSSLGPVGVVEQSHLEAMAETIVKESEEGQ